MITSACASCSPTDAHDLILSLYWGGGRGKMLSQVSSIRHRNVVVVYDPSFLRTDMTRPHQHACSSTVRVMAHGCVITVVRFTAVLLLYPLCLISKNRRKDWQSMFPCPLWERTLEQALWRSLHQLCVLLYVITASWAGLQCACPG